MTRTQLGFAIFMLTVSGVASLRSATWERAVSHSSLLDLRMEWPGWVNPAALTVGFVGVGLAMSLAATNRR